MMTLSGHANGVKSLAIDPKEEFLASSSCDGTMRVWALGSGKQVHCEDAACAKDGEPYFNVLTRFLAVRCMPAAEYVCAGEAADLGMSLNHYGLATPLYAHFTSPMRRYADQVCVCHPTNDFSAMCLPSHS